MLKRIFNRGHGRFLAMLSEYIDGELPAQEQAALEAHLQGCDSCTEELESLRATVQLLSRMPEVEAPRSFRLSESEVQVDVPAFAMSAPLASSRPEEHPAPAPTPERPVFLWAMRVSTALAVVAFTVMVAGNVTGLFEGGGGTSDSPALSERASDPESEPTAMKEPTSTAVPASAPRPTPQAMMEAEPDMPPRSTPMMMPEPTATPEPEAAMEEPMPMPEPTAMPDEALSIDSTEDSLEYDGIAVGDAPTPQPTPEPSPSATPVPTPAPDPTATLRERPTATPLPAPAPTAAPAPTTTPFQWASSVDEMEETGGIGAVLGATVGLGALAGVLAIGTIYLTLRRRRG